MIITATWPHQPTAAHVKNIERMETGQKVYKYSTSCAVWTLSAVHFPRACGFTLKNISTGSVIDEWFIDECQRKFIVKLEKLLKCVLWVEILLSVPVNALFCLSWISGLSCWFHFVCFAKLCCSRSIYYNFLSLLVKKKPSRLIM